MTQARQDGISLKQWFPLIGLACCAFVFNTSEFMPIGLLTDIAVSFSLTEAQAGIMISVYAWGVMLLSLPLMVCASRFEFKRMLLGVLAVFSLGQFLSAVAPTYPILVCARLVVACAHAVFWSVASIMASRLVDTRHGALAISMIATGSSIAQIFGLPIGRAIGLAVGWRMTFAVVGAFSAAAVVYQAAVFPARPAGERFAVKQLPELLKNPFLIALYAVTVFMATGYYTGYSYIEPFLAQVAHVDHSDFGQTYVLIAGGKSDQPKLARQGVVVTLGRWGGRAQQRARPRQVSQHDSHRPGVVPGRGVLLLEAGLVLLVYHHQP